MTPIVNFIKAKMGITEKERLTEREQNESFEKWKQYQYANEVHTDAGFEQMELNNEVNNKVPIHLSKLYPDYKLREEYLKRKKELQEI